MGRRDSIKKTGAVIAAAPVVAASSDVAASTLREEAAKSPGPDAPNAALERHPGFAMAGHDDTPGRKAYYINLEAKPGYEERVEAFLRDILAGVEQEPGTGPWFGLRFSDTTFGIFESFADKAGRDAHNVGPGGRNFLRSVELKEMLARPARVYRLDVMFGKFTTMFGKSITSG